MRKKLPDVLTRAEVRALLAQPNRRYPTGLRNYTMMLLMYRTGLRVSEVVSLQPHHIDRSREHITVKDGKGGKDRVVPIEPYVLSAVDAWLTVKAKLPSAKGKPVFTTLRGGPLDTRYVRAMIDREAKAAGIDKHVHPHLLRHTYATELLDEGLTIREVQELLGHADVSTTMIYTHVNPVQLSAKIRARNVDCST